MAQPLPGAVGPQAVQLVEQLIGTLNAHLAQTFPLVAKFNAGDRRFAVPAVLAPDLVEPLLVMHLDLCRLVIDAAGMRRRLAEVERLDPPPVPVRLRVEALDLLRGQIVWQAP